MPHERFTRVVGYLVAEVFDNEVWFKTGLIDTADEAYIEINHRNKDEAQAGEFEPRRYIVLEVRRN